MSPLKTAKLKTNFFLAALGYAKKGLLVFPCHDVSEVVCSCGKSDCKSAGKHPRVNGWQEQATADTEMIKAWWNLWPNANIGIATGPGSGVLGVGC